MDSAEAARETGLRHAVDTAPAKRPLCAAKAFRYEDEDGVTRSVASKDVNVYLRDAAVQDVAAEDFRTWAGTLIAARTLRELPRFASETEAKRSVVAAMKGVGTSLRSTAAVCRGCRVYPTVTTTLLAGQQARQTAHSRRSLASDESVFPRLLERGR